jgi:glycosyltransferase involved in cell wall biosynthesis
VKSKVSPGKNYKTARCAILLDDFSAEAGGKFSFQNMVVSQMIRQYNIDEIDLEIFLITKSTVFKAKNPEFNLVKFGLRSSLYCISTLQKFQFMFRSFRGGNSSPPTRESLRINLLLKFFNVDFVLAIHQLRAPLAVPFGTVIFDLAHIDTPWLPEIRSGEEWNRRENENREVSQRSSFIVTGATEHKVKLVTRWGLDSSKVKVLPFPIHKCSCGEEVKLAPRENNLVVYPAQYWPHKNHLTFVNAVSMVHRNFPDIRVIFLGGSHGGMWAKVKEHIQRLALAENIEMMGFVPQSSLFKIYHQANALLFPSLIGPDNLPPLEAIAHGVPRIAISDLPGARNLYNNSFDYFNPYDANSLAFMLSSFMEFREGSSSQIVARRELQKAHTIENYCSHLFQEMEILRLESRLEKGGF